jgi:hypothetical protein
MTTAALETTGYRAPLALQCSDASTGEAVADGLQAMTWRPGDATTVRTARRSAISATLSFATLPGQRVQEFAKVLGDGPVTYPATPPTPFLVSVVDTQRRYLPQLFHISVPQAAPVAVRLYADAARPRPAGWGTVHGEVHRNSDGSPVGWALVDVTLNGGTRTALCDELGRFLLFLPYPESLPALAGDPPLGNGIADVTWQTTVAVRSQPGALTWPAAPAPSGPPDQASINGQAAAPLVDGGGQHATLGATLTFGVPLLLRLSAVPS